MSWFSRLARGPRRPAASPRLRCESLEERLAFSAVTLTAQEQLLLELVNRARANPVAEVARAGLSDLNQGLTAGTISATPKQPLAPSQALVNAAGLHSQDMLDRDYFSHFSPEGRSPSDRAITAGYPVGVGENIAWGGSTFTLDQVAEVRDRHTALFRSPGHRTNILSDSYRELGTGVRFGKYTSGGVTFNASMVTEKFGNRGANAFITGVAYSDAVVADSFYTIGEGAGDITIVARNDASGTTYSTTSGPSGGYALAVPDGTYTVTATGSSIQGAVNVAGVVVNAKNTKVDLVTTQGTPIAPIPPVTTNGRGIVGRNGGSWWQAESTGSGLVSQIWGLWPTDATWSDSIVGDVDGDGRDDVLARNHTGQWWVARSNGDEFVNELWTTWSTRVSWNDVQLGDFNGDGRQDLIGRASDGSWWVGRSSGTNFVNEFWGSWSRTVNWSNVSVGDFNGDGRDDMAGRANNAAWWVAKSNGSGFSHERWGAWSATVNWTDVQVGDFNGDGKDDLLGRAGRTWWVGESNGALFTSKAFASWSDRITWSDIRVGDFDGNGTDDIAGRTSGQWWISRAVNNQVLTESWGAWNSTTSWSDVLLLDVNADGLMDLVGRDGSSWYVGRSTGSRFVTSLWGNWPTAQGWTNVRAGNFG